MENIIVKNRVRLNRGKLSNFYDLPKDKQNIFFLIKKYIDNVYSKNVDIEIHGSYKHGYWDDLSDFDVIINERGFDCKELSRKIRVDLNMKIDIFYSRNKFNTVIIPSESI